MREEAKDKLKETLTRYRVDTTTLDFSGSFKEINEWLLANTMHRFKFSHYFDCCRPEDGTYNLYWFGELVFEIHDDVAASLRSLK